MALADGLIYDFDKAIPANTLDAHRLVKMAEQFQLAGEASEALFKAYFTAGRNIGDIHTLGLLGKEIGLAESRVIQMLKSKEFSDEVNKDLKLARTIGITGVPYFLFNGSLAISGAQPVPAFLIALDEAKKKREEPAGNSGHTTGA